MSGFAPLYDSGTGRASAWAASNDAAHVVPQNITAKFREAFETFDTTARWLSTTGTGDLIYLDGNTASASYLVISKDPLTTGTESVIETRSTFNFPIEIAVGISMSQRTLGQDFSVEVVDTDTPLPDVPDLAISAISQSATTLTVDTVNAHNLSVGKSIGIYGCSNQAMNYPALVVATVTSPTQFTCTAGPGGTIASQTLSNPAGAKGSVFFRERLGRANNGVSQIFENATTTNASIYVRSESGDAFPSGIVAGSHSVTIGTTASVQLANAPYAYSFTPTTEYRLLLQADRVQFADSAVDATAQMTSRVVRTQVCPNPSADYKLRIRAVNAKSLTVPTAQIVSASKTGTTTTTIVTNVPHNLVTGDLVVVYGLRDQTNFPNLVTPVAATVVDATTFTTTIAGAVTATTYGGFISKVSGGNNPSALGANAIVAQSATLTTLTDGTRQLTVVGSGTWASLSIGDGVNLIGVRNNVNGTSLGIDGAWKVANLATTTLTLVPLPGTVVPANFASTDCGGAVYRRTELRLSFLRIFDYERQRVEMLARPASDAASAAPVSIQNTPAVTISSGTVTTVSTVTAVTTAGTPAAPATPHFVNSAAGTNAALISSSASGLQAFFASNIGATDAYVKLYNKTTTPAVGTDMPEMVIRVPATGQVEITPGFNGYRFGSGLGIAITGAAADADTTAVAAGQVKVKLSRTA